MAALLTMLDATIFRLGDPVIVKGRPVGLVTTGNDDPLGMYSSSDPTGDTNGTLIGSLTVIDAAFDNTDPVYRVAVILNCRAFKYS